jgi:hypothetical protein
MWPDGKSSKERFRNLRAELWWLLRCRFEKAHSHTLYLAGNADGAQFPDEEMISIPNHPALIAQLSTPLYHYTETGKIQIESKRDMQKRGIASPDFADALTLAFARMPGSWVVVAKLTERMVPRFEGW